MDTVPARRTLRKKGNAEIVRTEREVTTVNSVILGGFIYS